MLHQIGVFHRDVEVEEYSPAPSDQAQRWLLQKLQGVQGMLLQRAMFKGKDEDRWISILDPLGLVSVSAHV